MDGGEGGAFTCAVPGRLSNEKSKEGMDWRLFWLACTLSEQNASRSAQWSFFCKPSIQRERKASFFVFILFNALFLVMSYDDSYWFF